jgi:transcriptional regulator with XRE-family HTH domain
MDYRYCVSYNVIIHLLPEDSAAGRGQAWMAGDQTVGPETDPTSFGRTLRLFRERSGLSQNALAAAASTDPGTVNRLESGKRAPVNRALLARLGAVLGLSEAERARMMGLAGHVPDPVARLGLCDPELLLLADILSDKTIPESERDDVRDVLRILARRWRQIPVASLPAANAAPHLPSSGLGAGTAKERDWGCWL